ncbi:hypothetical protein [Pedobacter steynii]|nr:hypothetical protein [Pedobacter steynii]
MKRTNGSADASELKKHCSCSSPGILQDANRRLTHHIKQNRHE